MFGMEYMGLTFTQLRAVLTSAWNAHSQLFFTYGICPILLCWVAYLLNVFYGFSKIAAFVPALFMAVGFQFWTDLYGADSYIAALFFCTVLLAVRAKFESPFVELPLRRLFLVSVIAGLAFYNTRLSQLLIIPFFVPWRWAWGQFQQILKERKPWFVGLKWVAFVLIGFGFFLEVFGENLGTWQGRVVRIHAKPNFDYACYILFALWFSHWGFHLARKHFKRILVMAAGFFIGFLPEVLFYIELGRIPSGGGWGTRDFHGILSELGRLPVVFRELWAAGNDVGRIFSLGILIWAGMSFLKLVKKDRRF